MTSSKQWELAKQIISEFPEYTFSGMDDIDQHHALPWLENLLTDTIKQAVDDSLNDVWEKVEGLKKDRPHEIPFDSYHERMAGVIGNNQALDQVLSILKEKE